MGEETANRRQSPCQTSNVSVATPLCEGFWLRPRLRPRVHGLLAALQELAASWPRNWLGFQDDRRCPREGTCFLPHNHHRLSPAQPATRRARGPTGYGERPPRSGRKGVTILPEVPCHCGPDSFHTQDGRPGPPRASFPPRSVESHAQWRATPGERCFLTRCWAKQPTRLHPPPTILSRARRGPGRCLQVTGARKLRVPPLWPDR